MSNGGFGLSGRAGLALPGRLEVKDRETKKKEKGKGRRRGKSSKTIVKIQKGTGIRTIEDPQENFRVIALKRENFNSTQAWRTACNTGGSFSSGRDMTSEMYRVDIFFNSQVFWFFVVFFLIHVA